MRFRSIWGRLRAIIEKNGLEGKDSTLKCKNHSFTQASVYDTIKVSTLRRLCFMINNITIKLNREKFHDKVYACWIGKNIGGTMGAPYECKRATFDIRGFATAPGNPLPNDDLDLQLVWLHAVEQRGPLAINASVLGEYWLDLIVPNWNEYGIGKNNMRRGLTAPMSGDYENSWKDSNGAWIRTEVWACMAPGCPALAAKYAMEDAKVDHGAGEGTVAAAFVAAMQSAAFVISDLRVCVELALRSIPTKSRMADSVRFILDCFDKGMDPIDARNAIQQRNADIGDGWFEAPSNVSYALIGLLWGKGDFKRSMITAINCGDDTDCTGATVGATLGIIGGSAVIPEDWKAYIGDDIITVSINRGDGATGGGVPKSCTELTERVVAQAPFVLFANKAYTSFTDGEDEIPEAIAEYLGIQCDTMRETTVFCPYTAHFDSAALTADIVLDKAPDIEPNGEITVDAVIKTYRSLGDGLSNLTFRWWLPDGFSVISGKQTAVITNKNPHDSGSAMVRFTIKAGETVAPTNRCVLEVVAEGRPDPLYISVLLLG